MKHLKSIYSILETIKSYDWNLLSEKDNKIRYNFKDMQGNQYLVEFKNLPGRKDDLNNQWELTYYVNDNGNFSVSKIVNVNPFKVLKTVFDDILNDFIKRVSLVKIITLFGLSKNKESSHISKRTRMYVRYLERNPISGYKLETFGNKINLVKI